MNSKFLFAVISALFVLLFGQSVYAVASAPVTAQGSTPGSVPAPGSPQIRLDTVRIPSPVRDMIIGDLNALDRLQFGPNVDPQFQMFFGGNNSRAIEWYLIARVRYVSTYQDDNDPAKLEADVYAANFGPSFLSYYFHSAILREQKARPEVADFEHTQIALTYPRVGFVGIGAAYVDPKTSQIDRIDTWVHEARHSDCPRIPGAADLAMLDHEDYTHVSLTALMCTHAHVPCPKGHPLEGQLACDAHPWGAYSAGFIFAKNVYRACANCTEQQKQDALASATDDYTRLLPAVREFLRNPTPPAPDMSSYDARRFQR